MRFGAPSLWACAPHSGRFGAPGKTRTCDTGFRSEPI